MFGVCIFKVKLNIGSFLPVIAAHSILELALAQIIWQIYKQNSMHIIGRLKYLIIS